MITAFAFHGLHTLIAAIIMAMLSARMHAQQYLCIV
jgi:hypothetical protein